LDFPGGKNFLGSAVMILPVAFLGYFSTLIVPAYWRPFVRAEGKRIGSELFA